MNKAENRFYRTKQEPTTCHESFESVWSEILTNENLIGATDLQLLNLKMLCWEAYNKGAHWVLDQATTPQPK